jgi:hypothetical protein
VKWRALTNRTIESDHGYTVLQCTANDVPTGRYLAFAGRTICIGGYDSPEEAKQCCDRHLYTTQQQAVA